MELSLVINTPNAQKEIPYLKNFIDRTDIDGIDKTEIERGKHVPGTQGFEILNSIKLIIEAAEKPLVSLVECLQSYVNNYRSDITITNSKGASLTINVGRSIDKETVKEIARLFHEENV